MANMTSSGGRMARLIDDSGEGWYHVYNRVACNKDEMPLENIPEARQTFIRYINFYTAAYACEVATYTVMGNHYHLILRMKPYENLPRETLQKHAQALYPNTHELTKLWSDEHWEQLNRRLFNVADLMRNIQQGFARWFNKNHNRRGRFWADRFKSTILYGEKSLVECMQYVDLNPLRAGLVERPEDYTHGAFALRAQNNAQHLCDLRPLFNEKTKAKAFEQYRSQVYARGSVPSKEGDAVLPEAIIEGEMERHFKIGAKDEAREHFRFYVDGLVIGLRDKVEGWLAKLQDSGVYIRRKNPIPIKKGLEWFSLREQRGHFEGG
jgi:putative transposase